MVDVEADLAPRPLPLGPAAIADVVLMGEHDWTVVLSGDDDDLNELREELTYLSEEEGLGAVGVVSLENSVETLLDQLTQERCDFVVWAGDIGELPETELRRLDRIRNRALDGPRVVLHTTLQGAARVAAFAPNIWSWVGARCFTLASAEARMSIEQRLQSLRVHYDMTDEQMVEAWSSGKLEPESGLAEWLALLGRGDLLGG